MKPEDEDKDQPVMHLRFIIQITLVGALTACSQFPELDDPVSEEVRDAPYAKLVPIETLQLQPPEAAIDETTRESLEARRARLKSRASAMKADVIDPATQSRLQSATQ